MKIKTAMICAMFMILCSMTAAAEDNAAIQAAGKATANVQADTGTATANSNPVITESQAGSLPQPESDTPAIGDQPAVKTFRDFVNRDNFFQLDIYGANDWWNWTFSQTAPQPYTPAGNNYGYLIGARIDFTGYFGLSYEYQSVQVNSIVPFINSGGSNLTMVDNYNTVSDLNFLVRLTPDDKPVQVKWMLGYRWNKLASFGNYGNQSAGAYVCLDGVQTGLQVESGKALFGRIRPYARAEINTVSWNIRPGLTIEAVPHVEVGAAYDYTSSLAVNGIDFTNREWLYGVTFRF